jgi:exosortase E/protease (VPEID-CTERM system)
VLASDLLASLGKAAMGNPRAAFVMSPGSKADRMAVQQDPTDVLRDVEARRSSWRSRLERFARPAAAISIAAIEILTVSLLFSFEVDVPYWQHPAYWLRHLQMLVIVAAVAWAIMMWPRRTDVAALWEDTAGERRWGVPLAVNLGLFTALAIASALFSLHAAQAASPPWGLFRLYCVPLAATALSMFWLFAPVAFWLGLVKRFWSEIGLALAAGAALLTAGAFAQTAWERLAWVTLELSFRLLALYEPTVEVDYATRSLTVGNYQVIIDQSCSGYEGMALVSAFLALYLWTFRATLKFPNAFLLLPFGILAIFALNIVRIAVLVSIGAHLSPEVAGGGFHSQAGWMSFLAVTLGFMAAAPRLAFFSIETRTDRPVERQAAAAIEPFVVPFMALMAGSILASASAPFDTWLYGAKIALAGAALVAFRAAYVRFLEGDVGLAALVGGLVGLVWIVSDPGVAPAKATDLGAWLAAQPAELAVLWLAVRSVGGIIVVPIVEELAFRGLLYRWIIDRRFETVGFDRLSWGALAVSSALFGLMHSRPVAGAAAGAVFALLMVRRGKLADAVVAHIAANAVIILWAIAARQWTLL